jgi:hypothetical protein
MKLTFSVIFFSILSTGNLDAGIGKLYLFNRQLFHCFHFLYLVSVAGEWNVIVVRVDRRFRRGAATGSNVDHVTCATRFWREIWFRKKIVSKFCGTLLTIGRRSVCCRSIHHTCTYVSYKTLALNESSWFSATVVIVINDTTTPLPKFPEVHVNLKKTLVSRYHWPHSADC